MFRDVARMNLRPCFSAVGSSDSSNLKDLIAISMSEVLFVYLNGGAAGGPKAMKLQLDNDGQDAATNSDRLKSLGIL
jgi:hypothetical protein